MKRKESSRNTKGLCLRYVITTYVDAYSVEEAIKKARHTSPHEVNIQGNWWDRNNYSLSEEQQTPPIGFKNGNRKPAA